MCFTASSQTPKPSTRAGVTRWIRHAAQCLAFSALLLTHGSVLHAQAPSVSATKTDTFADPDNDGKAGPGDTIQYSVTIQNAAGASTATGVQPTDPVSNLLNSCPLEN